MPEKQVKPIENAMLTMSEACRILGVSEAALRQWTDGGKVKAFITPGGHRRYAESELRQLMKQHRQHPHGLRDLGDRLESVVVRQRDAAHQYMQSATWYRVLDDDAKGRLRERGKRMVNVLADYVTRPPKRQQLIEDCRAIGREYGEDLAHVGLSLTEALEAFILHRNTVSEATMELLGNSAPVDRRTLAAIPQINRLIDETLVALVETHQRVTAETRSDGG